MLIDTRSIAQVIALCKIAVTIVGSAGIVAGFVWMLVFMVQLTVEGLRLLQSTLIELNSLVVSMPVVHFLFSLAMFCVVVTLVVWLLTSTIKCVRWGVHYVR